MHLRHQSRHWVCLDRTTHFYSILLCCSSSVRFARWSDVNSQFSIGLRSGLRTGPLQNIHLFVHYFCVALPVCFRSLSCWKMHVLPSRSWPPSLVSLNGHSVCEDGLFLADWHMPYSFNLSIYVGFNWWIQLWGKFSDLDQFFVSIPWLMLSNQLFRECFVFMMWL